MFKLFGKKQPQPGKEIRDTLFGDMLWSEWPPDTSNVQSEEPWLSFVNARKCSEAGQTDEAISILTKITGMSDIEPRHHLQAWHFLRQLGVKPPANVEKELYGVVVEVALKKGLDIVAAYSDHSARYYNYSGAGVVWEKPDNSLNGSIDELLKAGRHVVENIGPWEGLRPPAPPKGDVRISMLTPNGLYFGQGPFEALASDGIGGPVINAATKLMQELIQKTEESHA